jgi:hypothetical protein
MRLEYERERTRLLDLYGNSSGEAAAANRTKHHRPVLSFGVRCGGVTQRVRFGRFLDFSTAVENRGSSPSNFTRAPLPLLLGAY